VNWTVEALIEAEELGVTQANVGAMTTSQDPEIQQLLGRPLGTGKLLGVDTKWVAHVIEATGNYGEIFNRDLGAKSPLRIDRGDDRLSTNGGVMLARPVDQR
jgi:general L-amino acid transport system substrate-binding protein